VSRRRQERKSVLHSAQATTLQCTNSVPMSPTRIIMSVLQ
jgi:hypothetical protein